MTTRNAFVKVNWIGKKTFNLPKGKKYVTVAKFAEDADWAKEAWSIILEFDESPEVQGNPSKAKAHFLVADAPQDRLQAGKSFELYEGIDKVAEVEIKQVIEC